MCKMCCRLVDCLGKAFFCPEDFGAFAIAIFVDDKCICLIIVSEHHLNHILSNARSLPRDNTGHIAQQFSAAQCVVCSFGRLRLS